MKKSFQTKYFTIYFYDGDDSPHRLEDYTYDIVFYSKLVQPPVSKEELKGLADFIYSLVVEENNNEI